MPKHLFAAAREVGAPRLREQRLGTFTNFVNSAICWIAIREAAKAADCRLSMSSGPPGPRVGSRRFAGWHASRGDDLGRDRGAGPPASCRCTCR